MSSTIRQRPRAIAFFERHVRALSAATTVVMVVFVAWLAAQLVWVLMPMPEAARWVPPPLPMTPVQAHEAVTVGTNLPQLFGRYVPGDKADIGDAPDTRLSLTLRGILAGSGKESRALIAGASEEKPYAVGDAIASGVRLAEVHADRVILSRGGKYETLRLIKDAPSAASPSARPVTQVAAADDVPAAVLVGAESAPVVPGAAANASATDESPASSGAAASGQQVPAIAADERRPSSGSQGNGQGTQSARRARQNAGRGSNNGNR